MNKLIGVVATTIISAGLSFSALADISHRQCIPNCNESSTISLWFAKSRAFWHKFS